MGNLDPRFFYISEKTLSDPKLLKKTVLRASQLDQVEKLNINMRTLEGKLKVIKDKNGKWKLDDFAAKYKIISKINY